MTSIFSDFGFLKSIYVPEKIKIMHNFIEKLLRIQPSQLRDDVVKDENKNILYQKIERTVKAEEAFIISKLEYETKEKRFIKLTAYTEDKLDILYSLKNLMFKDIDPELLLQGINSRSLDDLVTALDHTQIIIKGATNVCFKRMQLFTREWDDMTEELLNKIKNFEQRGLKKVSNNLRLKLIPELNEMKMALKEKLVKKAGSRDEINQKILDMVIKAREDIFGDLTEHQITLYEDLSPTTSSYQIVDMITNDSSRGNFIELIKTGKIEIRIEKLVDILI